MSIRSPPSSYTDFDTIFCWRYSRKVDIWGSSDIKVIFVRVWLRMVWYQRLLPLPWFLLGRWPAAFFLKMLWLICHTTRRHTAVRYTKSWQQIVCCFVWIKYIAHTFCTQSTSVISSIRHGIKASQTVGFTTVYICSEHGTLRRATHVQPKRKAFLFVEAFVVTVLLVGEILCPRHSTQYAESQKKK